MSELKKSMVRRNDLMNLVGNVVGDLEGNKRHTNCSAYGDKGDIPKDFQ